MYETKNLVDTALRLCRDLECVRDNGNRFLIPNSTALRPYVSNSEEDQKKAAEAYTTQIRLKKKDMKTPERIFRAQLGYLPSITMAATKPIFDKYGGPGGLVATYQDILKRTKSNPASGEQQCKNLLVGLEYMPEKPKDPRNPRPLTIKKAQSARVYEAFKPMPSALD